MGIKNTTLGYYVMSGQELGVLSDYEQMVRVTKLIGNNRRKEKKEQYTNNHDHTA